VIECTRFHHVNKGHLVGFAELYIPRWKAIIKGVKLYEKDGARWVSMPSEKYTDKEGNDRYSPIIKFTEQDVTDKFCEQAKQAIDAWIESGAGQAQQTQGMMHDMATTFRRGMHG